MKIPITILSLLFFISMICGCKKEQVVKSTNISTQQAAIMAASSLSLNTYGFSSIKNDITTYASKFALVGKGCGVLDSFAVAKQDPSSSATNYNYALGYYYTIDCTTGLNNNLNSTVIYNGSFDAPNLSAVNNTTSNLKVSSLTDFGLNYTVTGTYQTTGSFQTIDESYLTGNSTININVKSLQVAKSTHNIVNGTADITISGTVKNTKNKFSYTGSVIFNDANTATLTLPGISYKMNLITSDITVL